MNSLRVFSNPEFGEVRTIIIDGEPWFVGNDVARALGYSKTGEAIKTNVQDMDTALAGVMDSMGRVQKTTVINESGLYDLVFESRLPSAKKFRHWVTSDVLPSIRKTGLYSIQEKPDSYTIENPAERARRWAEEYEEKVLLEKQNQKLESENEELKPKAMICDKLIDSSLLVNFRDAAKEIGISQSQFTGWLKEKGYVYSNSAGELRPMENYVASGLFEMKPYQNPHSGYCGSRTYITSRGLAAFKIMLDTSGHNRDTMPKHGGRKRK